MKVKTKFLCDKDKCDGPNEIFKGEGYYHLVTESQGIIRLEYDLCSTRCVFTIIEQLYVELLGTAQNSTMPLDSNWFKVFLEQKVM